MSVSQVLATPVEETVESSALVPRKGSIWSRDAECAETMCCARRSMTCWPPGPATPWSYAPSGEDNAQLDKRDRVTVDSVRTHTTKHFPVQQTAHATYREILERRARENQVDFVEGVAIALTPMAFYEVVMAKVFRTLVDDGTEVSVETGLRAAEKLQSVLEGRERGTDVLELRVQLGRIGEAVRAVVPQEMWRRSSRSWRSWSSTRSARRRHGLLR